MAMALTLGHWPWDRARKDRCEFPQSSNVAIVDIVGRRNGFG
jgi:hypothetical protein